ncbi:magnesium/cobalt transporter CorA [Leptolyngbya sp. FACHB-261]|uniref:magnesium/cobalt transporter CorA n=1 Tax=Leptolyngbya sp. FACHB-261 TaxID=2692806 RepID=UPI00168A0992|nr:magnesium/cobalt transporter CorA [Leptolyngbya sp. FACHB-261]MBD2100600.1 magnesium/cobalt transporter CorA [Leptolyngbya sp. FACHB-261]
MEAWPPSSQSASNHHPFSSRSPDALVIQPDAVPTRIQVIQYSKDNARKFIVEDPEDLKAYLSKPETVTWIDVQGLGKAEVLQSIAQVLNLHPLLLAQVVNVPQRPRAENFNTHQLIITRNVTPKMASAADAGFDLEQISLVIGPGYVVTFQEEPEHDCFEPVRERIRRRNSLLHAHGADFLAYALLDATIEGFFPVIEDYGERLEDLEIEIVERPKQPSLQRINRVKRELLTLRRAAWPMRDAINEILREDCPLIGDSVRVYLRECYDHTVQIIDIIETYREVASSLMDVYLSSLSNQTNEVMKVLTIISVIFIPLTFIAGIYGMNFNTERSPLNMPELNWYWGYPAVLAVMAAIGGGMTFYFWRKGWIGGPRR